MNGLLVPARGKVVYSTEQSENRTYCYVLFATNSTLPFEYPASR